MRLWAFLILLFPQLLWAWGVRGHATICETAVFLTQEQGLREYLQNKPQMMGHLCNIPDIYWRSVGADANKLGAPTHYIDVEVIGLKVSEIPVEAYKTLAEKYTGTPNLFKGKGEIKDFARDFGSIWWRADQFFRRVVDLNDTFKTATAPANNKEEQDENLPFNKAGFDMIINMGVMGHFVGDTSQPLHNTSDYDGYKAGHGGIHGYYEDTMVAYQDIDLIQKVYEKAKANASKASFLKQKTVLEKMRALSEVSAKDLPLIYKHDKMEKPSTVNEDKGMEIRVAAERKNPEKTAKLMKPLIINQMANSALLLAQLWDEGYAQIGRPSLKAYKSYKYPLTPDFIAPDYLPEAKKPGREKK